MWLKNIIKVAIMPSLAFSIISCSNDNNHLSGDTNMNISPIVIDTNKSPSELSNKEVAYAFIAKKRDLNSYKLTTHGQAVANIFNYTQVMNTQVIKRNNVYFEESKSSSTLVTVCHQSYQTEDKVAFRNKLKGDISVVETEEYQDLYGVLNSDLAIGGYILNESTIISTSREVHEEIISLTYELDGNMAGINTRVQMKEFGGLDEYPVFSSFTLTLTINEDWTPIKYVIDSNYKIKKVFEMNATQHLETMFSDIGDENIEIPNEEEFVEALN